MTVLDIARNYIKRGWNPVPIPRGAKGPITGDWPLQTITPENVAQHFNGAPQNIGVQLGPKSRGLADVDLDCPEALQLAPYILPATPAIFGRKSTPQAHHLYLVNDPEPVTAIQHHDEAAKMLVELRLGARPDKGAQTVFPGSQHKETGELIEWATDGEPLLIPYAKLTRVVREIAVGAVLLRHWPKTSGGRHELARRVGGFLARAGYEETVVGRLIEIVAREAGDDEAKDRRKAAVDAAAGLSKGEHVYGLPKLQESLGEKVANALAKIVGYSEPSTSTTIISATPFKWIDPAKIPARQWLYKPHYIRQFVSATFSPGGLGKTSLLTVEALAMAANKKLLGIQPSRQLRVWYWNGEDPMEELQRRFAAASKYHGVTEGEIAGHLFIDSGRTMPIVIAEDTRSGTRIAEPIIEQMIATIREHQIDVVIVDPFISCHRVNENDNAAIERVAKSWGLISEVTNCSISLAHHVRKTGGEAVTVEDGRGASALRDAVRTARTLNNMTVREAEDAEVNEIARLFYFRVDIGKRNLTKPAGKVDWFKLENVDLGNGPHIGGADGDEVGVVTAWTYPRVDALVITASDIQRVQDKISAGGPWRADQRSKNEPWVGIAVAQALGFDLGKRGDKRAVAKLVVGWLAAGFLKRGVGQDSRYETHSYVEAGENPGVDGPRGAGNA